MITLQHYPYWPAQTVDDIKDQLRTITNIRKDDITQIQNIQQTFVSGRKVGKIPANSADIVATDKVGDFNVTTGFAYYLVDNSGTPEWVRVAVGSF